jgi:phosphatidylglycerophosphate synthase
MGEYNLKDRRPIKEMFRKLAYGPTDVCVRLGISANAISYLSVLFAALACLMLYYSSRAPWLLLLAPWFAMLRLYCNMLDGMVAIKAGQASAVGEVVNEMPDRVSDCVIFVGLAHTPFAHTVLTYWVMLGMLFVAYVGVLGKAVGAGRQYSGLMAKPVRMYVLVLACTAQFFLASSPHAPTVAWGLSAVDLGLAVILVGLAQTTFVRTRRMVKRLAQKNA